MSSAVPIVTCGNNEVDAVKVHAGMKPEFEVLYAGFDLPATLKELPSLISGSAPESEPLHTHIGSNNFERRPLAVVCGGGYDDQAYERLRDACIEKCGSKAALGFNFFRADSKLTEKLHAEGKGPQMRTPEYGAAITRRLKSKLEEVGVRGGSSVESAGALFWY